MTYFLTVQDFDNKFIHKNKPLKSLDDALAIISPSYLPLSGGKQTSNVRFQGPATDPAGAEDVTNMWDRRHGYVGWHVTDLLGKRHGYAGHGYVACMVVLG